MPDLSEKIIYDTEENSVQAIQSGADLNRQDRFGLRPLIQAIICRKNKVLECLVETGADLEQIDFLGRTALQWASDRGEVDYCNYLLSYGANPNHYSADGQPILVNPILREQLELVDLFVSYDANYQFAQDYISAKLLGHRFELSGEADIVSPDAKFIPLSFEGFYLEFSTELIRRSLCNYLNSIPGTEFEKFQGKLNRILQAMKHAAQLTEYARHKDKTPFEPTIDALLDNDLLLIPAAYRGHAITFIKYGNLWAKCDRGVHNISDTVLIYEIGNPYALNKSFYKKLLYESKTEDFVTHEIKEILSLKIFKTLPTKSQLAGNCSWANVETSVPAMLYILNHESHEQSQHELVLVEKSINHFYNSWVEWDKDCALDESIEEFENADLLRKISKAVIFGSILIQRCDPKKSTEVARAKKILSLLVLPNYKFILENYRKVYLRTSAEKIGQRVMELFETCGLNLDSLTLQDAVGNNYGHRNAENFVRMTTALHVACLTGKLELVKYLVEKIKIDVNYLDRTGSTALMYASWKGFESIVAYLVEHSADTHIKNIKGGTALRYAAYADHAKIVNLLKE